MTATTDLTTFLALRKTPLHELDPAGSAAFGEAMASWLTHEEAWVRADAAERLATSVFWERPEGPPRYAVERFNWLIGRLEAANATRPDVVPAFLRIMRYRYPSGAHVPLVLSWLDRLDRDPPPGLGADIVLGARIMLAEPAAEWPSDRLIALLDDPSNWVRGCAAYMLGNSCDEDTVPSEAELFRLVSEKEIERPGIAGPFWTPMSFDQFGNRKAALWMMDLLERRRGPPPTHREMPANDIEFHLHEACSLLPDMVDRMMRGGFMALALMTATEMHQPVDGMEPHLRALATSPDSNIARRAADHLAAFYGDTAAQ